MDEIENGEERVLRREEIVEEAEPRAATVEEVEELVNEQAAPTSASDTNPTLLPANLPTPPHIPPPPTSSCPAAAAAASDEKRNKKTTTPRMDTTTSLLVGSVSVNDHSSSSDFESEDLDDLPEVFKCSICFEILLEPTTINCGHSFCRICLARWFEARKQARQSFVCPECRKQWSAYPEVDYSLRDAMQIWYADLLDARKRNLTPDDRNVLARFRSVGPSTFALFGGVGRPIIQRRIPINWRGMQFLLAILMNAALILGIILLSLVVMLVAPAPDIDDELLQKDEIRIDISQWTVSDVDHWLESLGTWTSAYRPAFTEANIDGSWLLLLDEDILAMPPLSVANKLYARRLHSEIMHLKMANNPKSGIPKKDVSLLGQDPSPSSANAAESSETMPDSIATNNAQISRQKIFVLILGLLHFPRTITLMSYFVIDLQPITEFLNSVNVIQKDKLEEELPEVSWWIVIKFIMLPQLTILQESIRSGGQIEGFVRLLVVILLIRMCEEIKLYMTCMRLLVRRQYGQLYRLWLGELCRFGRDFSMVVAMGYLHSVLPSALIDVYFCYIVCYPALSFCYSLLRLLYRRVPVFRNVGVVFVQSVERSLNVVITYLLRLLFGWLIPQIIRLIEPAFRQAAAEQRQQQQQVPQQPGGANQMNAAHRDAAAAADVALRRRLQLAAENVQLAADIAHVDDDQVGGGAPGGPPQLRAAAPRNMIPDEIPVE